MAQSITLTTSDADAARIVAAAQGLGFGSGAGAVRAILVGAVQTAVRQYEQQQQLTQFENSYTPVSLT